MTTRQRAPMRDVVRIIEVIGARRKPRQQIPCIGCVVEAQVKRDAIGASSDLPPELLPDAIAVARQRAPRIK